MALPKDALKAGLDAGVKKSSMASPHDSFLEMLGAKPSQKETEVEVDIALLDWHPEQHRFSMDKDDLLSLAESIEDIGVLDAIHVQPKGNGRYTILAGHCRVEALKLLGKTAIPAKIDDVDEKMAAIIFAGTNLFTRKLRPSEKAFAYQIIEKSQSAPSRRTTAAIVSETGESRRNIQRYKRLNELTPALIQKVDTEEISLYAAVELSHLTSLSQDLLTTVMQKNEIASISIQQATDLRHLHNECDSLDIRTIRSIICSKLSAPSRRTQTEKKKKERILKIPFAQLQPFFSSDTLDEDIVRDILAALLKNQSEDE